MCKVIQEERLWGLIPRTVFMDFCLANPDSIVKSDNRHIDKVGECITFIMKSLNQIGDP